MIDRLKPYVPGHVRRLARGVRDLIATTPERNPRAAGGPLRPITDVRSGDVVVVGYPKSGNTWFQFLVAGAIHGLDTTLSPPALVSRLVPDVHFRPNFRRFHDPMFFKSHALPRPEYRRVVHLLRDGRDVMVSYLHHLRAVRGDDAVGALELVRTGEGLNPCKWHEHVRAWTTNPYAADMITIRYEDLLADGVRELQRLCEFVGIERDPTFLAGVVERAGFQRLQERERITAAHSNPRWPKDRPFFRRGQAGSYRDEMSPEVLAAFMAEAGQTLSDMGYL